MTFCKTGWLHAWGQWESYSAQLTRRATTDPLTGVYHEYDPPLSLSELWQKRKCLTCGHEQHQKIRNF